MKYILGNEKGNQCVFCAAAQQEDGHENLIIARGEHAFVILNRFPYTSGHIMVVPYAHQPSLPDLDEPTRREIIELLNRGLLVLQAVYKPEGFNVGANIGGVAGAGIAEHFQPENLVGKRVIIVANLAPRKLKGIESQGMILSAADAEGKLGLVAPPDGWTGGWIVK